MSTSLANLMTNEDIKVVHDLKQLLPIVKNKWFSMGRDMDRLNKLLDSFGKLKEEVSHGVIVESCSGSSISGNTLVRVRQTIITNT